MDRRQLLVRALAAALVPALPRAALASPESTFHAIYDHVVLRDQFFGFLQHVFHLYPEDRLHYLIREATAAHAGDEAIYREVVAGIPEIKPLLSELTYAIPALQVQKTVLASQTVRLVGDGEVDGYVEVGTTGRYVRQLSERVSLRGPLWVVNDRPPAATPVDWIERGQLAEIGTFVPLGGYDPLTPIPDASVDLVTVMIGLHHCPDDALEAFVADLRRVLRPAGHLVIREHDAEGADLQAVVTLAHDVFNAGTGVDWPGNQAELRHFRPLTEWFEVLARGGFVQSGDLLAQPHDPTRNLLVHYEPG
ncbi:MAG: SAM-dependent methyltransferase [Myxococcota bacterium]|jgi:SAM-dependent methyltransferase